MYFTIIGGYLFSISICATWFIALAWFRCTFVKANPTILFSLTFFLVGFVGALGLIAAEFVPRIMSSRFNGNFSWMKLYVLKNLQCFGLQLCVENFLHHPIRSPLLPRDLFPWFWFCCSRQVAARSPTQTQSNTICSTEICTVFDCRFVSSLHCCWILRNFL